MFQASYSKRVGGRFLPSDWAAYEQVGFVNFNDAYMLSLLLYHMFECGGKILSVRRTTHFLLTSREIQCAQKSTT